MMASVRKHLEIRNALSVILTLATYFFYVALAVASQRSLEVINLSSSSTADEVSKAREALAKRGAIIVMTDRASDEFRSTFGSYIASSKAFTSKSNTRVPNPTASESEPLTLHGVAAYVDARGIAHSVQALAPANDSDPARQGWRKHLDDWIQAEQTKASTGVGDPTPPQKAWTLLYETTIQASGGSNYEQNTIEIFRLNTISTGADYYMVFSEPEVKPAWSGQCNGFDQCDWHTMSRSFTHGASPSTQLIDHGPTGTVGDGSAGFSIGAGLGAEGPGGSVEFSTEWSQPAVSTVDHSTSAAASWDEAFQMKALTSPCNPPGGSDSVPGTSSGTFTSEQGSIFEVPEGTTNISFTVTAVANFCDYEPRTPRLGVNWDTVNLGATLSLGPPVLQAAPKSLTIPAGGNAPLLVGAYIPNSEQGLPWTIKSNQLWLTVPSEGSFTTGQIIPVTVAPGTPDGTPGGTLSINTSPSFAAPSVTTGPILVNVTVGPKDSSTAGILLFGGLGLDAPAEFYDLASQAAFPVTPKVPRQVGHTATLLNTGNILVAGGITKVYPFEVTAAAELYQPASFSFAPAGKLATARGEHTATLLPDGKVLVVGGVGADGSSLASAELYDPAKQTFSSAGNLHTPRSYHYATLMRSDPGAPTQVVVYGGKTTSSSPDHGWELWDESKNAFITTGTMAAPADGIPQPVVPPTTDAFFLVGGDNDNDQPTEQEQLLGVGNYPLFSLSSAHLQVPRAFHTLTNLPDGAGLLVTGGAVSHTNLASAEIRDQSGWSLLSGTATCPGSPGCMLAKREGHTATLLPDGRVFLVGGNTSGPSTEFYDPASKTFAEGPPLQSRTNHTATLVVTTATSLIATPPDSTVGQNVNLAATVTSAVGTPTGSVHFLDGAKELGSAELVKGQASFDVATLSIGAHALKAVYSGGGVSSGSESAVVTQTVHGSTSSTSLALSPNPSQFGSAVTMTATVSGTGGPVTGTVVFSDRGKQIASADLAKGSATAHVNDLSAGTHPITATYKGNENTQGSTSATLTQTVTKDKLGTSTTLSSSNNPSNSGQSVTFRAKVDPISGTGVPTGTVNFMDGSTVLGSASLVSGTVSFTTSSLAEGPHAIVGMYLGDSTFSLSNSSVLTQTVSSTGGKVTPKVDLTVNGSTSSTVSVGDKVIFVARIHAAPGYPWPTGSITISDSTNGNNQYGAADIVKDPKSNDGLATIPNSGIGAGGYTLVATYGGDNEGKYYNGARSNTVSLRVEPKLGGPPPQPSLAISAKAGARNGQLLLVPLTLTNNGRAPASGITLNQIELRTLAGKGEAELFAPTLPVIVGKLQPGESTVITLELQVPTTIRKLALSEHGRFQDARGTVHQFSPGQVVVP